MFSCALHYGMMRVVYVHSMMQELLLDVVITCYACDVNFLLLYWVTAMLSGCLVVFSP